MSGLIARPRCAPSIRMVVQLECDALVLLTIRAYEALPESGMCPVCHRVTRIRRWPGLP